MQNRRAHSEKTYANEDLERILQALVAREAKVVDAFLHLALEAVSAR